MNIQQISTKKIITGIIILVSLLYFFQEPILRNTVNRYCIVTQKNFSYDGKEQSETAILLDTKTGATWSKLTDYRWHPMYFSAQSKNETYSPN